MTDFRSLCQELMDAIDSGIPVERIKQSPLAVRIEAALSQPEQQEPPRNCWLHDEPDSCPSPCVFTVRIRRAYGRPVRPEALQLDGNSYVFQRGWIMDADDPYPGEVAWIACDPGYPFDAPTWIASGDLEKCPIEGDYEA